MRKILIFLAIVLVFIVSVMFIVGKWRVEYREGSEPTIDRAGFITGCSTSAMRSNDITLDEANRYCVCVLDNGTEQYGVREFSGMINDMGVTHKASPQLQILIDHCNGETVRRA